MAQATATTDIKLVILDVDNTLLDTNHELSDRNKQAVEQAVATGVRVILATGKTYGSCKAIMEALNIDDACIFTQGLTIHNADGTMRHQQTLAPEVARRVITFAEDRGFAVIAYSQGRILARRANPLTDELATKWKEVQAEYVGPLQNVIGNMPINKLIVMSGDAEHRLKSLRWQLSAQLNGSANLISGGVGNMLEIVPPNTSKGKALKTLLKEMNIKPDQVMAIGDAENDLEMIQLAGIGVAVGNAQQVLKDAADEVTSTNDENGVAIAIEKYVLGKQTPDIPATTAPSIEEKPSDEVTKPKPEDDVPPTEKVAGQDDKTN